MQDFTTLQLQFKNQIHMKTKKIIAGTALGAILLFVLGFLIYGMLIMDYMDAYTNRCNARPESEMIWWAIIVSNILSALLLALVISWSNNYSAGNGVKIGTVMGLLIAASFDFSFYSMTTMFSNFMVLVLDSCGFAVMMGITGLLTAMLMGKIGSGNKHEQI